MHTRARKGSLAPSRLKAPVSNSVAGLAAAVDAVTNRGDGPEGDLLNANEAACFLRLHPKTVYRLIANGELPSLRAGNRVRFSRADLQAWLRRDRSKARRPLAATKRSERDLSSTGCTR